MTKRLNWKQFIKFWDYLNDIEKDKIEQEYKDSTDELSGYTDLGRLKKDFKEFIIACYREEILKIVKLKILKGFETLSEQLEEICWNLIDIVTTIKK